MEAGGISSCKGILLLKELLEVIIGWGDAVNKGDDQAKVGFEGKAHDVCQRLHQHLLVQAAIPDNEMLCDYGDRPGGTVKELLEREKKDLEEVASGQQSGIKALERMRVDISHSDGMKQLLVCAGPFANEISDVAKIAGFALKLLSGTAYSDPQLSVDERDGILLLMHVAEALRRHKLEWSGRPPDG